MDKIAATLVFKNRHAPEQTESLPNAVSAAVEMLADARDIYSNEIIPGSPSMSMWCAVWCLMATVVLGTCLVRETHLPLLGVVTTSIPMIWILVQWFNDRIKQDAAHRFVGLSVITDTPEERAMALVKEPRLQAKVDACLGGLLTMRYHYAYPIDIDAACRAAYVVLCSDDKEFRARPQEEQVFAVALQAVYDVVKRA